MVAYGYTAPPYMPALPTTAYPKMSMPPVYSQPSISTPVPNPVYQPSSTPVTSYKPEFKPFDVNYSMAQIPTIAPQSFSYSMPSAPPQVSIKHVDVPVPNPTAPVNYAPVHVPIPSYSVYAPVPTTPHVPTPPPPTVSYPPPPAPPSYPPVGGGQGGYVQGDPHFTDPDDKAGNTSFDFFHTGKFNVLSDKTGPGLALHETFAKDNWGDATVTKQADLTLGTDKVAIDRADNGFAVKLNGQAVQGDTVSFNGNTLNKTGNELTIKTADAFEYDFKFTKQGGGSGAGTYLDTGITSKDKGIANGALPTGILGDTWRGDGVISTAIVNPWESYLIK